MKLDKMQLLIEQTPKGLTIDQIIKELEISRPTAYKYRDILEEKQQIEIEGMNPQILKPLIPKRKILTSSNTFFNPIMEEFDFIWIMESKLKLLKFGFKKLEGQYEKKYLEIMKSYLRGLVNSFNDSEFFSLKLRDEGKMFKHIIEVRKKTTQQRVTYNTLRGFKRDQVIEDLFNDVYYNKFLDFDLSLPSYESGKLIIDLMKDLIDEFCKLSHNDKTLQVLQEYYPEENIVLKTNERVAFYKTLLQDLKHELIFTSSFEKEIELSFDLELSIQKEIFQIILRALFMNPEIYEQIEKIEDLFFKFKFEYKPGEKLRNYIYNNPMKKNKEDNEENLLKNIKALAQYLFGVDFSKKDTPQLKFINVYQKLLAKSLSLSIITVEKELYKFENEKRKEFSLNEEITKIIKDFSIVTRFNRMHSHSIGGTIMDKIKYKQVIHPIFSEAAIYHALERDIENLSTSLQTFKDFLKGRLDSLIEKHLENE